MADKLKHQSHEPSKLSYDLIKKFTANFQKVLGRGAFGIVYKGVTDNDEEIAVKVLRHDISWGLDDTIFQKEFDNLTGLKHPNIVELVGFCNEIMDESVEHNGEQITVARVHRALCFEYVHNGSLNKFISDHNGGLDWGKRYKIIKGVCEGLKYLYEGLKHPIIHLDLKPDNILLDKNMVAKIADFGISRLIGEENTKKTISPIGTLGYWPPEYIHRKIISNEFDIFSLGVIIVKIMVGDESYGSIVEMTRRNSVKQVCERWRSRLRGNVPRVTLLDVYCNQVEKCIQIALDCLKPVRQERPTINYIVSSLNKTETTLGDQGMRNDEPLLDIHPLELCFPFFPSDSDPKKKAMLSCLLELSNKENDRIAFMLVASKPKRYFTKKPLYGVVPPGCVYSLSLTMPKHLPPDSGDFFTLYSVALDENQLRDIDKDCISVYEDFFKKTKRNTMALEEVQEVILKAICGRQPQGTPSEIIIMPDAKQVTSIDVHPTEPWIMTTNNVGSLRVWDYNTMTTLDSFELTRYEPVYAAKFIAQEKWLVAGDGNGGIHVYSYDQKQHLESFDGHDSCVTSLTVHPTHTLMLSSSDDDDHLIKLWDWGNGWNCTRVFHGHDDKVTQVTFNPEDNDSFASASSDGTVKIWNIDGPNDIITLTMEYRKSLLCVDYFRRCNRQHLIVGCKDKTPQIWKLGQNVCCDKLKGHAGHITSVQLHPDTKLSLLITGSLDGTVRIWNSTTYKLENIIGFNLGEVYAFGCITDSKRIVVGCHQGMAVMEIPSLEDQRRKLQNNSKHL
ncbi:unnamed protein product [Alopecurus aequalis]